MPERESPSNKRVAVAMSGGVDSSVAAAILVDQGYQVIGMMLRLWSEPGQGNGRPANRCCTPDQMADARRVADQLRIPFYVLDAQELFHHKVVRFFIDEHLAGRTPNPCIECNREIRFNYLLGRAMGLGADYLATGHYARVQRTPNGYQLLRAVDASKDQSYVLHVLGQKELARALLPVGKFPKEKVREMAASYELPVVGKSESMDLCFLGDGDYRRFLREHAPESGHSGPIYSQSGTLIGEHNGLANYTIGQRKGLGVALGKPAYVIRKDTARNALVVGSRHELGCRELLATGVNWVAGRPPDGAIQAGVKIRYRAAANTATVTALNGGKEAKVVFNEPVYGVTSGQGAVFYEEEACLGGGIIADKEAQ
jgi:tRNA-specific 2-thiouridylase